MVLPPNTCRLCAERGNMTISIFKEEGRKVNLQHKLRICSPVTVRESDSLPKEVCLDCLSNLDHVYEFYQKSKKAQVTLEAMDKLENSAKRNSSEEKDSQELKRKCVGSVVYTYEGNLPKDEPLTSPQRDYNDSSDIPSNTSTSDKNNSKTNATPLKKELLSPPTVQASTNQSNIQKPKKPASVDESSAKKQQSSTKETSSATAQNSSEKPTQQCRHCKVYFPEDVLPQHEALHSGRSVYECLPCKRAFMTPEAYNRHIARHNRPNSNENS